MKVRIEYHNGDWEIMELADDENFNILYEALKHGVGYLSGNVGGRKAAVLISAVRCIQEWDE